MALLRSLTGGTHALPIGANAPQPDPKDTRVVFVGPEPTEVELTPAELRVCLAKGHVEKVEPPAPPAPASQPDTRPDTPEAKKAK